MNHPSSTKQGHSAVFEKQQESSHPTVRSCLQRVIGLRELINAYQSSITENIAQVTGHIPMPSEADGLSFKESSSPQGTINALHEELHKLEFAIQQLEYTSILAARL